MILRKELIMAIKSEKTQSIFLNILKKVASFETAEKFYHLLLYRANSSNDQACYVLINTLKWQKYKNAILIISC